jgi:hypothetical protein
MARRTKEDLPELPPEIEEAAEESFEAAPVHLHRTPPVPGGTMMMGEQWGQEVRIPIWEDSHRYTSGAYRLSVSRITPEGIQASLGFLPASATEDHVIARGRGQAGTYLVMPVDEHGEPMRRQPYRRTVDEDHPAVKRYQNSTSAAAAHSGVAMLHGHAGADPEMLSFFQTVLTAKDAERDELMGYVRERDRQMSKLREETAQMQLAVATDHTRSALEVQQQILDADRSRQEHVQAQQLEMLRRQQEAEREAREAEAARAQNFYAAMLDQQRVATEAERARREDDQLRREAELRRREEGLREEERRREAWMREQEAARQERLERERQRDREHMELVIKMLEKQHEVADPFANVAKLLEKGAELKELIPGLFGKDAAPQGVMGMVSGLVTEGMKTFVELQKAQLAAEPEPIELQSMPMTPEVAAQMQLEGYAPPQIPAAPMAPPPMPMPSADEEMQRRMAAAFGSPGAPAPTPALEAPPMPPAVVQSATFDPPSGVQLPPAVGKLEPTVRKKAREAIRELVTAVRSTPEAQWQATITTGIMRTPQIVSYITAATIRLALLEAGADAPLAQKIIDAVNATGIVPDSIPRG